MDMTLRLDASAPDFSDRFTALLSMKRESSPDVDTTVRKIIEDVCARGDEALVDYSRQFDRVDLAKTGIAITAAEIDGAEAKCSREQLAALDLALERITALPRAPAAERPALHRRRRRRARLALDARSRRSAFTCPAARRPILPRC